MGFDALDKTAAHKLANQTQHISENYGPIDLQAKSKKQDLVPINQVYQEHFPFWSAPYQLGHAIPLESFTLGNRVLNLNSSNRAFVPFGLRGTVVGRTERKVIVLFDK